MYCLSEPVFRRMVATLGFAPASRSIFIKAKEVSPSFFSAALKSAVYLSSSDQSNHIIKVEYAISADPSVSVMSSCIFLFAASMASTSSCSYSTAIMRAVFPLIFTAFTSAPDSSSRRTVEAQPTSLVPSEH